MPIGSAEITDGILGETVKAFAKGLVVDFLPHIEQPLRRRGFRKRHCGHVILLVLSRKLFRAAGFGVIANCPSVFSLKAHCGVVLLLWLDGGLIALPPRQRRCRVSRQCGVPSPRAAP